MQAEEQGVSMLKGILSKGTTLVTKITTQK
jgi:hypothetical protein